MLRVLFVTIFISIITLYGVEIKETTSIGFGATQEEAVDNGLREGLAKVAGLYMSTSTFVKNYQTINDEITSFSNGYIESYSVISSEQKNGMIEVQLQMKVKTGVLIKKLKDLNISTLSVVVDSEQVKRDLKKREIMKVNQERLTEEYHKQIIEPIKLNKSHYIKINNFSAHQIVDIPKTHYGGELLIKDLKTGLEESFNHSIYLNEDDKYDFMDKYYIIKVNYQFGITDDYYNNCISFMDAAFKKVDGNIRLADLDVKRKGGENFFISNLSTIMKSGTPEHTYTIDGRTINKFNNYFKKNRKESSYKLSYNFIAYDGSGFPILDFNYNKGRDITEKNNIMAFEAVNDPRGQIVQFSKRGKTLDDKRYYFSQRERICEGILKENSRSELVKSTFLGGKYGGNMYIFKDDYGISFNIYLAVPKEMITKVAEMKAELTTE